MTGIKYTSLNGLNTKAYAWCNKVDNKIYGTTNENPFGRSKEEFLSPLKEDISLTKLIYVKLKRTALSIMLIICTLH